MPHARPHPQAQWTRGEHGIGHVNTHGDVVTQNVDRQFSLGQARMMTPASAHSHFVITPGGHVDARMTGSMTTPEFYRLLQQAHRNIAPKWTRPWEEIRVAGLDDPEEDPEFDEARRRLDPKWQEERNELVDGLEGMKPQWEEITRARGMNDPDWEPLEHVIPPSHCGDWMFMGYNDGVREYKHRDTRRYLHLIPRDEAIAHPKWGQYLPENRPNMDPRLHTDPGIGKQLPYIALAPHGYKNPHSIVPHHLTPRSHADAVDYAYEGIDELGGTHPFRDPPDTPRMARWQTWSAEDEPEWNEETYDRLFPGMRMPSWEKRNQQGKGVDPVDLRAYPDMSIGTKDKIFIEKCPVCKDVDPQGCQRCDGLGEIGTTPVPYPGAGDGAFSPHRVDPSPGAVQPNLGPRHQGAWSTIDDDYERMMGAYGPHEDRKHARTHHPQWREGGHDHDTGWSDYHEARPESADWRDRARELRLPGLWREVLGHRDELGDGHPWSDVPDLRVRSRRALGASFDPVAGLLEQFPHWQPLAYGGASDHRVWGWTDANGVAHSAGCGAGIHGESARKQDAKHLLQRFRRCEAGACNCAQRAAPAAPQAPQAPAERPLAPGDRVQQGWVTEVDGGHAVVVNDQGEEDILPVAELRRSSVWHMSDMDGYTNWHTMSTGQWIDNDEKHSRAAERLVGKGGTPEQLRDWAIKNIIGPYNRQAIKDAQEWNAIPEHDRLDYRYEDFKDKHEDKPGAMDLIHGLVGGPDVSDSEPDLIDPELVNWKELHDDIRNGMDENAKFDRDQATNAGKWDFFTTGQRDESNHMLDAWMKHHDVDPTADSGYARGQYGHMTFVPADELMRTQTPQHWQTLTEERAGVPIHETERWQKEVAPNGGASFNTRDLGWDAIARITRGAATDQQRRTMTNALLNAGHDGPAISRIMRPTWRWNPQTEQMERLGPQAPEPEEDPSLDKPGELRMPPGWTAAKHGGIDEWTEDYDPRTHPPATCPGCSEPYEHPRERLYGCQQCGYMRGRDMDPSRDHEYFWSRGKPDPLLGPLKSMPWLALFEPRQGASEQPAQPDETLPPHALELFHYLRGLEVSGQGDTKVPNAETSGQFDADPSYADDNPSSPDPSPGALTS